MCSNLIIGKEVKKIFDEVLDSRQALIISPWIDGEYAKSVFKMIKEDRARVITSMDDNNDLYKLVMEYIQNNDIYVTRYVTNEKYRAVGIMLILLGIIFMALTKINDLFVLIGFLVLIFGIAFIGSGRAQIKEVVPWLLNIRFSPSQGSDGFIHIKLYVTDRNAYLGSANMTYSAWAKNFEAMVKIPKEDAITLFDKAWSITRSIEDLQRQVKGQVEESMKVKSGN
ncbi:MAG: phospholipase D-like domain-containing protein [Vulcanisaeta sp.]|uniref:phospholipase D-like domain-containing protein n=1 Tax=Vulcanisaeta sp. TaxID=2020871 RepID=UPI003D11EAA3